MTFQIHVSECRNICWIFLFFGTIKSPLRMLQQNFPNLFSLPFMSLSQFLCETYSLERLCGITKQSVKAVEREISLPTLSHRDDRPFYAVPLALCYIDAQYPRKSEAHHKKSTKTRNKKPR